METYPHVINSFTTLRVNIKNMIFTRRLWFLKIFPLVLSEKMTLKAITFKRIHYAHTHMFFAYKKQFYYISVDSPKIGQPELPSYFHKILNILIFKRKPPLSSLHMHHSNKPYVLYIKLKSRKQSLWFYQSKSHRKKRWFIWTELM